MQTWPERFPELFAADYWGWGDLDVRFQTEAPPDELISNVHVIGRTDGGIVVCGNDLGWRFLPGGTREPGETIEQAAAREVFEEAGIRCTTKADYLFCQPWPFPSSLMIGLILEADEGDITVDESELETARWFTREETASMMAGTNPDAFPPMPFAIAHHVIKAWLERG
mgnify:CR=1 FL=1